MAKAIVGIPDFTPMVVVGNFCSVLQCFKQCNVKAIGNPLQKHLYQFILIFLPPNCKSKKVTLKTQTFILFMQFCNSPEWLCVYELLVSRHVTRCRPCNYIKLYELWLELYELWQWNHLIMNVRSC